MGHSPKKHQSFVQLLAKTKEDSLQQKKGLAKLFLDSMGGLTPEGESMAQLNHTQAFPGMKAVFAFPDLHPGKGIPIGSAGVSQGLFYPHLAGSDIGCGVLLCRVSLDKNPSFENLARKTWLTPLKDDDFHASLAGLAKKYPKPVGRLGLFEHSFGTIGGGNHFAEIGRVQDAIGESPLENGQYTLMVHTGSRRMGDRIDRAWADSNKASGVKAGTIEADEWLENQEYAIEWALLNRLACARGVAKTLGGELSPICDVWHNGIEKVSVESYPRWADPLGGDLFIHRKGASRVDALIPLPTSRGEMSALLKSIDSTLEGNGLSCAHGAGRKWKRSECKARLEERFSLKDLKRTPLGGFVVSPDDLLWEEAPQAYKDGEAALRAITQTGQTQTLCLLRPMLTLKG